MATENGTAMSDLELAEAWLLSTNFDMFCRTLGAKLGTAEYARKAVSELRTKNERLLQEQEAIAKALGLKQEPFMLAEHVSALVEHLDMANEERTELQAENERLRRELEEARAGVYCLKSIADQNCVDCCGTGFSWEFQHEGNTPSDGFSYPEVCDCVGRGLEKPQFIDTYGCECGTCRTIRKFAAGE